LLFYAESFPQWLKLGLNGAWVAALLFPVGFWSRRGVASVTAVGIAGTGLAAIPAASMLIATPWCEWMAAAIGLMFGVLLQHALRANQERIR
jgi:hypothetical protein